jgi:hypothetical protein
MAWPVRQEYRELWQRDTSIEDVVRYECFLFRELVRARAEPRSFKGI